MSGIFGIIDVNKKSNPGLLVTQMADVMRHQDWHVADCFTDTNNRWALGRIGLGILNKTAQPLWNDARTVALVMAGEFYDRDELSEGTTSKTNEQIALAYYEQMGDQFASKFNGAFTIAILDQTRQRLLLTNDRFGLYPTYIAQSGDRFLFAPEVKGVLVDANINRSLRDDAVAEYIHFQRLLGSKTFFKGITVLPPASILIYNFGESKYNLQAYWDLSKVPTLPESITFNEAVEEGGRLYRAAVAKMTRGDERTGVFLSGGLDGRGILGMLLPGKSRIHTFTFGQPGCRDEFYARKIALAAGSDHHYYPYANGLWISELADMHMELTEGFHPWLHMHGINMLPLVREHVDVNLSGLGDLLWSQPNFTPRHLIYAPDDIAFNSVFYELYNQKYTWPGITYAEERYLYDEKFYPRVQGLAFDSFVKELVPYQNLDFPLRAAAFNLHNHFTRFLLYAAIFGRAYIEYRFPYFDLELLSFCYAIPYELGYDRRLQEAIIAREMPALARIPYEANELPVATGNRRSIAYFSKKLKSGIHKLLPPIFPPRSTLYADYEGWLRAELRPWAETILFDERTLSRGIFRPEALHSLMDRHIANHQEWTIGKIAHIITFEMMLRRYYD